MALVDKKRSNSHYNLQEKKRKNGSYHVPEEIQREILLRVPVKSVLRFRSLNRKSRHLISTQQFVTDRLKTPRQDKDILLLLNHYWCEDHRYRLYLDGISSVRPSFLQDLAPPYGKTDCEMVRVGDYCNGVVCLMYKINRHKYDIVLWNPCTRKSMVIPLPQYLPYFSHERLGFGCVNDEYKLVRIPYRYVIGTPLKAIVCYSNTRNWAVVACSWAGPEHHVSWEICCEVTSVFMNGACHWLARDAKCADFVLSFNLSKEAYGKIALPSDSSVWGVSNSIHVYKESLYLVVNKKTGFVVWEMKEYGRFDSWTKIMESNHLTKHFRYVLGFMGGGQLVYSRSRQKKRATYQQELVCYDPITKESHYWKAKHMLCPVGRLHVYRENLALLNQDVQVSED